MATGYLQKTATWLSSSLTGLGGVDYDSPIKGALKAALKPIKAVIHAVTDSERLQAALLILVSGLLIYFALLFLVKVMRSAMSSRVETMVSRGLYTSPIVAMILGVVVTVMVQSSSITTSLLVPLAGAGLITLRAGLPDHDRGEYRHDGDRLPRRSGGDGAQCTGGGDDRRGSPSVQCERHDADLPHQEDTGDSAECGEAPGSTCGQVQGAGDRLYSDSVLWTTRPVRIVEPGAVIGGT